MLGPFDKFRNNKLGFGGFRHKPVQVDMEMVRNALVRRQEESFKGDYGQAFIIAGSVGFAGAAYLTTQSAVRSGAGLVTLCVPKEIQDVMSIKLNEAMTINFEQSDKIGNVMVKSNCIAIGPGMGNTKLVFNIVKSMIENAECPIVIDADGINSLQQNLEVLERKNNSIILTPHYGEMARITGLSVDEIKENRIEVARDFAEEHDVIVLLKDHRTIITDGNYVFENTTGNSAMASGGMGDALTGIITSFIAQGYEPLVATYIATFVHGYCGDRLSENMFCVNATHIVEELPFAIKEIIG
ncbi:MAG: NAD(P)H-hydrate dehydratase [Clostridium sp.]|uniref:NAD(P)H-hydrate dehydratase n=1 Tax=Clostridium sp. TaxID=1506 RepID=UPI003050F43B